MADFAAVHAAEAAGLADAERREVVVQDKALGRLAAGVVVEVLRLVRRGQSGEGHGLRFTAREKGGAVGAREHAHLGLELAQVVQSAPVAALFAVEDADAEGFLLQVVEGLADGERRGFGELLLDGGFHFLAQGVHRLGAGDFAVGVEGRLDAVAGHGVGDLEERVIDLQRRVVALGFARLGGQLALHGDEFAHRFLREIERRLEIGLGHLVCRAFDHDDFVFLADINEVEVALLALRVRGVYDKLSVDAPDAHGADGTGERDVRHGQRGRGTVDAEDVGIVLAVRAEQQADDLRLEEIILREERAQRTVGHARGEGFLLGGASFALEVTAGEFAGRGRLFLVIDSEREEVLPFAEFGGRDGAGEDDGVAAADHDGAVGEFGDFAGFEGDLVLADLAGDDLM